MRANEFILDSSLREAAYKGNIGMMELFRFQQMATPEQREKLQSLISRKLINAAWKLIEKVTGIELVGKEFGHETQDEIVTELSPRQINTQIDQQQWKRLGRGATASVWQHLMDPDVVVKVTGGGSEDLLKRGMHRSTRAGTIAFVDFLVHNGYKSRHLPIVYGINLEHEEVAQVKIEKLVPYKGWKQERLFMILADESALHRPGAWKDEVRYYLYLSGLPVEKNNPDDLMRTMVLLENAIPEYNKKYRIDLGMDLHENNWMIRPSTGEIVANDPWFTGW